MYNLKEMVNIASLEIHGYFAYLIINVITQNKDLLVKMLFVQQKHLFLNVKQIKDICVILNYMKKQYIKMINCFLK